MGDARRSLVPKSRGDRQTLYSDAERYDLVYGSYATGELVAFYRRQVSRYGEPVLELGCGSGRLLIPLAEDGTAITGIDVAPAMLDLARKKAASRSVAIDVSVMDMRRFDLDRRFKLVLLPANAMMHLVRREDIDACLAGVARHLAPGGRLVVEVYNPSVELLASPPDKRTPVAEYTDPQTGARIAVTSEIAYDAATQVNRVTYHYAATTPSGKPTAGPEALTLEMRQFFPQELDALLTHAGFTIEEKFGDRDETTFTSASPRQIVVCHIAGGSVRPKKRESKRPK
jgi:2-polyprenyl-3-methyl-5-hydroxy-6-metoxy-1,4-benzoquinol methylase